MELSINFIVMLILTITVFSLGLVFVNKLFVKAEQIKLDMDANTEEQVENLLSQGQIVAVPIASKTVKAGEVAVFALGVVNSLEDKASFKINIECFSCVKDNEDSCCTNVDSGDSCLCPAGVSAVDVNDIVDLQKNAKRSLPIGIVTEKSAKLGTYGFKISVLYYDVEGREAIYDGEKSHGTPKPIYVTVN